MRVFSKISALQTNNQSKRFTIIQQSLDNSSQPWDNCHLLVYSGADGKLTPS